MSREITTASPEEYISEIDIERRFGIHRRTLQTWRYQRRNLPFHRMGRLVRYRLADVEAFAAKNLVTVA